MVWEIGLFIDLITALYPYNFKINIDFQDFEVLVVHILEHLTAGKFSKIKVSSTK